MQLPDVQKEGGGVTARWRTAAILKTVKSPYLGNRLTDFDDFGHGDADWLPTGDRPLKFRIFVNPRWRRPPPLNRHISATV